MNNGDLPAAPLNVTTRCDDVYTTLDVDTEGGGLTKRETFAMAAMQGLLAGRGHGSWGVPDAVRYADDLLKALEETK